MSSFVAVLNIWFWFKLVKIGQTNWKKIYMWEPYLNLKQFHQIPGNEFLELMVRALNVTSDGTNMWG